ncbi:hypothetical protein OHS58_23750 [Amycolatopsis sp. NBC_00348]|uniref:hypothetical protein n=1 Tax=unclassified Amycolatopsis TaxID=2618356 RepID=UPI002E13450A|nr:MULTISPECIES: hypothetical protein [unclassified Amycolatopsis]WSJ77766.1 hypothetical protein OG439_01915 [Amycolatopsis sp. NBC_01307]
MQLSGFPAAEVGFDRAGGLAGDRGAAVRELAADRATTDLVVLSHGWDDDPVTARHLYADLASSLRSVCDGPLAFACVLWPSRKFAESAGLEERLDLLRELVPEHRRTIDAAAELVPALAARSTARTAFAAALLSVAAPAAQDREDASTELLTLPGGTVMDRLAKPASGFVEAARQLLDYLTYYEMKARAGEVGEHGLAPLLGAVARPGLRVHLVGHGFGGRLVTAAALARPAGTLGTLTLLQATLSHHAFAESGVFRGVLDAHVVTGPILVTHTAYDLVAGVAFEIASRVTGLGYGSIGRDGAQGTAEAVPGELLPVGGRYAWRPGVPHNLRADGFVRGHTDVHGPEIAHALWSAIAAG